MIGIYFSGTGNTKYCVENFILQLDKTALSFPIEAPEAIQQIQKSNTIIFGYPIYYSNLPFIVRDFIIQNRNLFQNKKIFIITTMGLFSGDSSGCAARLFKQQGAEIIGGLHLKMPDCIGDVKLLKKSKKGNQIIIQKAKQKIFLAANQYKNNNYPQDGLGIFSQVTGFLGQRLWFYRKTNSYKDAPNINHTKCIQCETCTYICPTHNLTMQDNIVHKNSKCTLCYRCFSQCPTQAITILGRQVYEQANFENYLD